MYRWRQSSHLKGNLSYQPRIELFMSCASLTISVSGETWKNLFLAHLLPQFGDCVLCRAWTPECACLMLTVWCDALWQTETSLGATCPLCQHHKLLPPLAHHWSGSHIAVPVTLGPGHSPLTKGCHWLTSDASPKSAWFWATATKGWRIMSLVGNVVEDGYCMGSDRGGGLRPSLFIFLFT